MKPNRYVVCPACDAMNPSFGETCDQCGAPIGDVPADESTQPRDSPVGPRHFQPPTTTRLIGMWMLSVPNVLGGVYLCFWLPRHFSGLAGFITFWLILGLTCLWFFIFFRVTWNYFFRKRNRESSS